MDSCVSDRQGNLRDSDACGMHIHTRTTLFRKVQRLDEDAIGKGKKSKNDHIEIAGDH